MADSRDDEVPDVKAEPSDISERQKDFTRRALLRAGWVVPMVTAINIPAASAQSVPPHNDAHGDTPHQDTDSIHTDVHLDTGGPHRQRPHRRRTIRRRIRRPAFRHAATHRRPIPTAAHRHAAHIDDQDAPHTYTPPHTDVPHSDTPPHTDVPHTDTPPHTDVPHVGHADPHRPSRRGNASRQSCGQPPRSW